ncbi:thiamine phosphate synthase [Methylobacterium sp. J-030]|uniref:thiamine phosphate synthase n=1 Tax=Methylobacterium sp. J-030 TaxID=2836627 RepID=UPI001FB8AE5A|nr:thiamine phosphate synthase [Methylobacterium sp. J-030]MCJ2070231.1 thiamine phosphate synthase [Methylobacterium sp. J-030]
MSHTTRLALLGPHGLDAAATEGFVSALRIACGAGDVAAVILRLAATDERGLITQVKQVAPVAQEHGAALVVACPGFTGDLAAVAIRGGADGVHVDKPRDLKDLRDRLRDGRILGVGGTETKHAAMEAGEAGVDYVMFGGLYPDGAAPDAEIVLSRVTWWAEIFETPCIAVATHVDAIGPLSATGAEFIGLESGLWLPVPAAVGQAQHALAQVPAR